MNVLLICYYLCLSIEVVKSLSDPKPSHQQPETIDDAMLLVESKQLENKKLINRISQLENDLRTMHKNMNKDALLSQVIYVVIITKS